MTRCPRSLPIALAAVAALAAAAAAEPVAGPEAAVIAPLAVRSLLLDVHALPGGALVAVGERGHVLVSSDGGVAWRQSPVPARANLTASYFTDAAHGWAVGHDEVILRTTDGGATWAVGHYAPERQQPLLGVWFDAAGHGIAVGAFATVYRSDDAGATWQLAPFAPEPLPPAAGAHSRPAATPSAHDEMREDEGITQPHLNAIAADHAGRLYVAGEAGHLYRSDDGGARWLQLAAPYEGSFFGVLPLEGDTVLAFGLRGHLYRSDDAGRSWQALATGTGALLAGGTRLADGTIVIAGLAGVVLVSSDGGHTFRVHQEADRKGLSAVAPTAGGVVLVGETGVRRLGLDALAPRG